MIRSCCALILCVVCWGSVRGDETPAEAAKRQANEVGQAVQRGEFGKVVDMTYPRVTAIAGGREKAIANMESSLKQMKEQGFAFRSFRVAEPSKIMTEQGNTFIIVPTTVEMTVPGGKAVSKSYLLGISTDRGKTWTFLDGSGLKSSAAREKLLPKLPAELKLPEIPEPEVVKDRPGGS